MSEIKKAKDAMRALAAKAQETVDSKSLTSAEKREGLDKIEADIKAFADTIAMHEQVARLAGSGDAIETTPAPEPAAQVARTIGAQVAQSKAYTDAVAAKQANSKFAFTAELKAAANPVDVGSTVSGYGMSGEAGALVTPDFQPGIVDLRFQTLTVADLMASGSTTSDIVSYVVEAAFNDNAGTVAEKGAIPQSDDTLARVSDQVSKIANRMKMTDEMLQDAAQFQSFLTNRLVFSLKRKEEQQLLHGSGTYPDIKGLLARTGLLAPVVTTSVATNGEGVVIDAIYEQITALRATSFVEPDAVLIHPTDWQNIRLAKDANKQYYGGGPFTGAYGNGGYSNVDNLWGLTVVITTAATAGSPLVGAFRQNAQVFRREGITVEMTNSNEDDFNNGLVSVRATERLALSVYRPNAFGLVTITA